MPKATLCPKNIQWASLGETCSYFETIMWMPGDLWHQSRGDWTWDTQSPARGLNRDWIQVFSRLTSHEGAKTLSLAAQDGMNTPRQSKDQAFKNCHDNIKLKGFSIGIEVKIPVFHYTNFLCSDQVCPLCRSYLSWPEFLIDIKGLTVSQSWYLKSAS